MREQVPTRRARVSTSVKPSKTGSSIVPSFSSSIEVAFKMDDEETDGGDITLEKGFTPFRETLFVKAGPGVKAWHWVAVAKARRP
eukprot:CAMPEP_0194278468 /NCGR_PEP_ID=MMETSP0169-20130528/11258_1 /TAXON_ID=218684 /ORGANISM="Corethron pennatum, Strain L29A3" /LENGTH=84 /DNA_ID=CAMNT_0039022659 /DNA_START=29 /DNA_END=283 /DNA_ORIENTATION=-